MIFHVIQLLAKLNVLNFEIRAKLNHYSISNDQYFCMKINHQTFLRELKFKVKLVLWGM